MNTNKWTPGPWHCGTFRAHGADSRFNGVDIGSDDGGNVALVHYQRDDIDPQECKANARLIAAAPDLAEALDPEELEAIADEIGEEFKHSARAHSLRIIAKKQRAALAKARGEE